MTDKDESSAGEASYGDALMAIARDIEGLKGAYPQLAEFSAAEHCDVAKLVITYSFHTGEPSGGGGWSGAVPSPEEDGIWFHLDFHDPDSTAQIHTQPVVPRMHYRDKSVMLLLREGTATQSAGSEIAKIMRKHGVADGPPGTASPK